MKKRRNKRTTQKTILKVCIFLFFAILIGYVGFDKYMDYKTMGCKVHVLGENVSYKTVDEAAQLLQEKFQNRKIVFKENGQELYSTTLGEAGFSLDETDLKQKLEEVKAAKPFCKLFFEKTVNYTVQILTTQSEEALRTQVSADHFGGNEGRQASESAYIVYNEESQAFEMVNSVLGTQIDEEKAYQKTSEILTGKIAESLMGDSISVDVTQEFYQEAEVTEAQEPLKVELVQLNNTLQKYFNAQVTYTFGSTTEVLTSDTVRSWVQVDGLNISLNEEAIREYVSQLGAKYNTIYVPRNFHTSNGTDIVIEGNEYGYRIDEDGETAQLLQDLESGGGVTREPVYSHKGYQRNGTDDLAGSYIEVDLTSQQLWLYKDGALITQTGIVSGTPTPERATYTGAFPIAYKESPAVLSSDIYGYETPVQYWMPFVYGQGLHDADWQSSFGGSVYKTNGSHGCINLPPSEAELIFNTIDAGYPILIY